MEQTILPHISTSKKTKKEKKKKAKILMNKGNEQLIHPRDSFI